MADPAAEALVVGADAQAVALALLLAAGGMEVRLHVPDPDDAARLRDGLGRTQAATGPVNGLTFSAGDLAGLSANLAIVAPEACDPVRVEPVLPDGAPLVLLDADLPPVAARLRDPGRLFALHPAGPIGPGALVELVAAPGARSEPAARLASVLRAAGLALLAARDRGAGTLAQRLALRLGDAVEALLLSGLAPWELDTALVATGCARGPLESQDLAGLDAARALRRRRAARLAAAGRPVPATPAQDRMVAEGRLGKAAGVGWYRYPGGGGAVIDPLIEDLIAEEAHFARQPRPGVAPEAAAGMLIAALLHEGAMALADGTATDAAALDLTARHLLDLPAAAPGLLSLGATMGLAGLAARLAELDSLGRGLIPPADVSDASANLAALVAPAALSSGRARR